MRPLRVLAACLLFGVSLASLDVRGQGVTIRRAGPPPMAVMDIGIEPQPAHGIWVATHGGGLFRVDADRLRRFDVGRGLPSAAVRQLEPAVDGSVLAATAQGLVAVDPQAFTYRKVNLGPFAGTSVRRGATLVKQSPVDKRIVVQLERAGEVSDRDPTLLLVTPDGANVEPVALPKGAMATAASVEPDRACLHVAGVVPAKDRLVPWLWSDCVDGRRSGRWIFEQDAPEKVIGVSAVARDPATGQMMLAIVTRGQWYELMQVDAGARLLRRCEGARFKQEVAAMAPFGGALAVAVSGLGVKRIDCKSPPAPLPGSERELKEATALALHPDGRLLIGTMHGVYSLIRGANEPSAVAVSTTGDTPAEAVPTDLRMSGDRGTVLVSSAREGIVEVALGEPTRVVREWRRGEGSPNVFGMAVYGDDDRVFVAAPSDGVYEPRGRDWVAVRPPQPWLSRQVMQLAVDRDRKGLWVGMGSTPFDPEGGGLQFIAGPGDAQPPIRIRDVMLLPGPMWVQDRTLWIASRAGVLRVGPEGKLVRLSQHRVEKVFRNASRGFLVAVGATIEQWDGRAFTPVTFAIPVSKWGGEHPGHPVDVVVDDAGRWAILYSEGKIALLDAERRSVEVVGLGQGLPTTSSHLLHVPGRDEILVGTREEGLFTLQRGN